MNAGNFSLWLALLIQFGLGLAVYRANSRNHANQGFVILSFVMSAWLLFLQLAFSANEAAKAEFWIRHSWGAGVLVVIGFNLLRLGILCRDTGWKQIGRRSALLATLSALAIALCYSKAFLRSATIPPQHDAGHELIPVPDYGPVFPFVAGFFVCATYQRPQLCHRRANNPAPRLCRQPAHPQAHRGGIRLDQDDRRASEDQLPWP